MMLAGQEVIVLGGTSGIGRATAQLAAQNGADVIINARDKFRVRRVAKRLRRATMSVSRPG